MKKLVILLSILSTGITHAEIISIDWLDGSSVYDTSTCTVGTDLILPSIPPTKYGYTFNGWEVVEYEYLEYITSSGTQWIDTGIIPTYNYTFEIRAIKQIARSLIGVTAGISYSLTGSGVNYLWRGNQYNLPGTIDNSIVHIWSVETDRLCCDNVCTSAPPPTTNSVATASWTLFARHTDNVTGVNDGGYHTIYYAKIWDDNGILVRDFIPARRLSDREIGMYDNVSKTFFENRGDGIFTAGPAL